MLTVARRLGILALAAALLVSCAGAQKPIGPVVRKLRMEGVHQVNQGELRSKILTTETFWLTGWLPSWFPFSNWKYFEPNAWNMDLRRIERFYQAAGFYQARVISSAVEPKPGNNVELKVEVDEGAPTVIQVLQIAGMELLPKHHQDLALANLPLRVGQTFREDAWNEFKSSLVQRLRNIGYVEASLRGEAQIDLAQKSARLEVHVDPGLRYRFGDVVVTHGPQAQVADDRVTEQVDAAAKKGSWYSDDALKEAQGRLFRMGVFGAAKVTAGEAKPEQEEVPIEVDVREAPFHSLRAGGGIGLDPVRQEARAITEYTDRNFLGDLRRLTLTGKAGYAFIPSAVAVFGDVPGTSPRSAPFFSLKANLTQPHFLARDVRLEGELETSSNIQQAYQYLGGRAKVGLIWQPHRSFSIRPSYNFEADRLWGQSVLVSGQAGPAAPSLTYGCPTNEATCNVFLSYLEQVIEWDRRDNALEPTRGFYLSLSLQEGGGPLGGSFEFIRILPDVRYYQPFGSHVTLAARVRAGTLIPLNGQPSPIVSRFFAGGANSMRGFGTNRLSPMQSAPSPYSTGFGTTAAPLGSIPGYTYGQIPGVTVPIGGNGLFEASLELRWEIIHNLELAFFSDAGMVTQSSFGGYPNGNEEGSSGSRSPYFANMQYAVGFGLRYRTPFGPIRVDLAHRLNVGPGLEVIQPNGAPIYYPTQGTCFGIGDKGQHISGAPEGPCAFHISIGEAF